ncbi:hypothetical protein F4778DRAFT_159581 [Xylariomycetidae sp. FL2044]|nr:hypothetical protein F4778DRAFT_159581 [Xylariomycetidae sp. FL2044]
MGATASVPTDPSRKLEVIDAGYARTATLSYAMALEKLLDGPVMHGGTQLFNREDAYCKKLAAIYRYSGAGDRARTLKALREATAGFAGCADVPLAHFVPELLELYPNAKVVLVTRDPESWWRSFSVFGENSDDASFSLLRWLLWPLPGARWFPIVAEGFQDDQMRIHGRKASGKEFVEMHNEWVRSHVPEDRLLEIDLAAGWGPLCEFLGKPVPDEPFPRVNDREARDRFMRRVLLQAGVAWAGVLSAAVAAGFGAWRFWHRR